MHMADALLSPAVGGTMWVVSAGTVAACSRNVRRELDERNVPLMGVMGAFLFAAQMINFTIPGTGSSGHLGGGLLVTILLGPHAAFLVIASVLVVQALFFADGGLLALGCNIFNMGFIPAFVVYPFIYRKLLGTDPTKRRRTLAIMLSALAGLQLGSFGVVLEIWCSGISALPFATFLLLMQPIHLAIGIIEGIVTVAVVSFVHQARPEIISTALETHPAGRHPIRTVALAFLAAALLTGGILSWFASRNPDGLEWATARITGQEALKGPEKGVHGILAGVQGVTAFLSDYSFRKPAVLSPGSVNTAGGETRKDERAGKSIAGIIGALLTLILAFGGGVILKMRSRTT